MDTHETPPVPTPEEESAGFSTQTLVYPENYELPRLTSDKGAQYLRCVAMTVDDTNRFRRRDDGTYVHEELDTNGWFVSDTFDTLEELTESNTYARFQSDSGNEIWDDVD